jgi:hypothetical protein
MNKECRHHFEARYTEESRDWDVQSVRGCSPEEFRKLVTLQKYVFDICIKCGKVIKE